MLLCPESEQFNPGKVFMFFRKQKKRKFSGIGRQIYGCLIYCFKPYCAIAVIKYFSVHTVNPPVSGAARSAVFP